MKTELKSYRYIVYFAMIVLAVVIAVKVFVMATVTVDSISYTQSDSVTMVVGSVSYNDSCDTYSVSNNQMSNITVLAGSIVDGATMEALSNGSIIVVTYDTEDNYTAVTITGLVTEESYYQARVDDVQSQRMSAQTYIILCGIALVLCGISLPFIFRYDKEHSDEQSNIVAG